MADYPDVVMPAGESLPVPRRVRATLGGRTVVDTTAARYVWEIPPYPYYYIPVADIDASLLEDAARVHTVHRDGPLAGYARLRWSALDAWFEEDEQVFVHPRNPYARVDALRSSRHVQVSIDGVPLADTHSPVLLFETGLPTRYYVPRPDVRFEHLTPSDTQTQCPYKGVTSGYWSFGERRDIAWCYDFPLPACASIAGLVAFYNEKVDLVVDGVALERPQTHFSPH